MITNAASSTDGEREEATGAKRRPAVLLRLDDAVDQDQQARRHGQCASNVEALVRVLVLRLRDIPQRRDEDGYPDRDVDEEDPRPRERRREDAAEHEADRAAADRDRGPDSHRLRPLGAFFVRRGDDRQSCRRDERGAEALEAAEDDQHFRARRQAVEQRRDREDHEADEEDLLASGEVAGSTTQQQETAEHQRVRIHDPLQVGIRHVEVGLDRGQRDVHDRRVEDHHELRHADEDEHEPRARVMAARGRCGDGDLAHKRAP